MSASVWRHETRSFVVDMPYPAWMFWRHGETRPRRYYVSAYLRGDCRLVRLDVIGRRVNPVFHRADSSTGAARDVKITPGD
jgi:hypothetical protein